MPELPEVETILRGLKPHLEGKMIQDIIIRQPQLRWKVPANIKSLTQKKRIEKIERRGKYLLIHLQQHTILIHLGMSASLRILAKTTAINKHDHVDIVFSDNTIMRYTDPRRFGAILITENHYEHPLIKGLGIEPLEDHFTAQYLLQKIKNHRTAIKAFIMDSKQVVGVGNIYATEALFLAGIHPLTQADSLHAKQCQKLVSAIKRILAAAIQRGGTTLKDFMNSDGKPGYFSQQLKVYNRSGKPCVKCQTTLVLLKIRQRSTVFCPSCQSPGPLTFKKSSNFIA